MTIEVSEYKEAKKVLTGGSAPVVAHGMGWPDDEWQRVTEVKASQGAWFARFFASSEKWTQIDGLEVRK